MPLTIICRNLILFMLIIEVSDAEKKNDRIIKKDKNITMGEDKSGIYFMTFFDACFIYCP